MSGPSFYPIVLDSMLFVSQGHRCNMYIDLAAQMTDFAAKQPVAGNLSVAGASVLEITNSFAGLYGGGLYAGGCVAVRRTQAGMQSRTFLSTSLAVGTRTCQGVPMQLGMFGFGSSSAFLLHAAESSSQHAKFAFGMFRGL